VSACEHFLRASMYFRVAEYFADPFGREGREWGMASRAAFLQAAKLLPDRIAAVEVPFEGKGLPGYFMVPASGAERGKTIVVLTGFDGTGEELYFQAAAAGLARGYNVLLAEGPGQAGCMRFHPELVFRPDYEKPIAAMIDFALAQPEVAAERLALYGISYGGYFVTRAGEHDRRIKALVVNFADRRSLCLRGRIYRRPECEQTTVAQARRGRFHSGQRLSPYFQTLVQDGLPPLRGGQSQRMANPP
jgi:dipeptidyl aminopeptidase/acylaminoacyl peptidase